MQGELAEEERLRRLRMQRNLFAVLAVCSVASIGFAVPQKIASYRELKAVNEHLVELQAAIVRNQQLVRETQDQILQVQGEITKRLAK